MGTITRSHTFSSGEILTADNLNGEINLILSTVNGGIDAANVDATAIPTLTATQTLTNKTLTAPKIGTSILDTGGNELFKLTATSSAVNEITVANAATGNGPTLTSTGGDTNIDLTLSGKGSGKVVVSGDLQISGDDLFMGTNTSGHMLIGDGTNYNPTALTGDVTINGSGVTNISSGVITTSEIAAATLVTEGEGIGSNDNDTTLPTSAAVKDYVDTQVLTEDTISELNDTTIGTLASGHILIWDGSDSWDNKALSGDVTIAANGTTAIGSGVIVNADVSGSAAIADSKLATITTGNKVSGSALQLASTSAIEDSTGVRLKSATAGTGLSMASQVLSVDASQTQITAVGSIATGTWAATDVAVTHGGTGSSTASGARTNLGVAIGSDVQAYDAGLASISGLTTAADKMVYTSGSDTYAVADLSSFARTILDDADAAAVRTTIGAQASGSYQTSDAGLTSIAGLTTAANKMIYTSGSDTYAVADLSAFARTILDDADAAAVRTTIGAQASGSYQASDAGLTSIAGLTTAADKMIYTSGSDTYAVADLSSFARTILDDANAAAVRATTGAAALGSNSDITSLSGLTTALSVPQGGTGATSLTGSGILLGGGTGAVSASAAMTTNGTLLIGGSGGPEVATLTAGSNVTITNGDGTITIAASGGGGGGASAFTDLSDVGSTTATAGRLMVADGDSWESVAVSGDVALAANGAMTIQANSVALATDTTGNYVATVADAGNSHITVANSGSENAAVTLNIADNAVGIAQLAGIARGKIIVGDSSNNPALLAAGSNGQVLQINGSGDAVWGAAASSGHVIQEEGSGLTARANLNFVGGAVTATDDSGNDATIVTVSASGASLPFTDSEGNSDAIALTSAAIGESLVTDTSPQLGGNLDVNGQSIVSDASNENIPITPHGTGSVVVSKIDVAAGEIDGTAIGANSASTGAFTTIAASGTTTLSGDQIIADGNGLISGHTARVQVGYATGENQILGTGDADANLSITRFSNDNGPPNLFFGKSRGSLGDVDSIVADGDPLGRILFCGSDGEDLRCVGAVIEAECDGEFELNNVSGRIVFATTPDDAGVVDAVERMRIDSAGNMILGGSNTTTNWTAEGKLFIEAAIPGIGLRDTTGSADDWMIVNSNGQFTIANDTDNTTAFSITDAGNVGIGRVASATLDVANSASNGFIIGTANGHATHPLGIDIDFSNSTPDNTTQWFLRGQDQSAVEFYIYSDGSFSQVSDINTKENIKPAESYKDGLKTLGVIEYNKKNDVDNRLHIGFSAQEVQKVYPHLVTKAQLDDEFNDDGELIEKPDQLMLNSIGLVPILWRNVQELEARVAALESA